MEFISNFDKPIINDDKGTYHPINYLLDNIVNFFDRQGFNVVLGPEVETEEFNFDLLNIRVNQMIRRCFTCSIRGTGIIWKFFS